MARPEHYRVQAMLKWLKQLESLQPVFTFRTHQAGKTKKGIPDIYICYWGVSLWVEAKKDQTCGPTDIQAKRIEMIRKAFGFAICTSNINDIRLAMLTIAADNENRYYCPKCRRFVPYHMFAACVHCENAIYRLVADHLKFPKVPKGHL